MQTWSVTLQLTYQKSSQYLQAFRIKCGKPSGTDWQTEGQTDGQTDKQMDGQTLRKPIVPCGFTGRGLIRVLTFYN